MGPELLCNTFCAFDCPPSLHAGPPAVRACLIHMHVLVLLSCTACTCALPHAVLPHAVLPLMCTVVYCMCTAMRTAPAVQGVLPDVGEAGAVAARVLGDVRAHARSERSRLVLTASSPSDGIRKHRHMKIDGKGSQASGGMKEADMSGLCLF